MTTEERLRSLLEAATPGPWVAQSPSDGHGFDWYIDTHYNADGPEPVWADSYPVSDADAALIVEAVNALPKLLAVVTAARRFADLAIDENRAVLRAALAALDEEGKR